MGTTIQSMGELIALAITCAYVFYCNGKFQTKNATYKLPTKNLLSILGAFWVFLVLGYFLNFPHILAPTHPEVVVVKQEAREECKRLTEEFDFAGAAIALKTNDIGKQLAREQLAKAPPTVGRFITTNLSSILFSIGVMYSILPFLLLLFLQVAHVRILQADVWGIVLPIVNVVSMFSFCVWLSFYFFIDGFSLSTCNPISGHWFMYLMTTIACLLVGAQLQYHLGSSNIFTFYCFYSVTFQAIILNSLSTTQTYYQDSFSACNSIFFTICLIPILMVVVVIVEYRMRYLRFMSMKRRAQEIRKLKQQAAQQKSEQKTSTPSSDDTPPEPSPSSSPVSAPASPEKKPSSSEKPPAPPAPPAAPSPPSPPPAPPAPAPAAPAAPAPPPTSSAPPPPPTSSAPPPPPTAPPPPTSSSSSSSSSSLLSQLQHGSKLKHVEKKNEPSLTSSKGDLNEMIEHFKKDSLRVAPDWREAKKAHKEMSPLEAKIMSIRSQVGLGDGFDDGDDDGDWDDWE